MQTIDFNNNKQSVTSDESQLLGDNPYSNIGPDAIVAIKNKVVGKKKKGQNPIKNAQAEDDSGDDDAVDAVIETIGRIQGKVIK